MDVNKIAQEYIARRDSAVRKAAENGTFQVGGRNGMAKRGHTGARRARPTVHWTERMVEGASRNPGVGRTQRGPVGQAAPAAGDYQGYPANGCAIDVAGSMPTGMGCEDVPPCGTNVIGGNTLGTTGIAPGTTGSVVITAGDAGYFQPRAIYFEGQPFATQDLIDPSVLPGGCCNVPLLLVDAAIGRVSMLRRGGSPDRALIQGGFANTKELVAVDWGEFVSTNEQNLTLFFYNPNQDITIHAFVDLWGNI